MSWRIEALDPATHGGHRRVMNQEEIIQTVRAALRAGVEQRAAGQLVEAAASFEKALAFAPREPEILYLSATVIHALGDPAKAARRLGMALATAPDEARYHHELARALVSLGRLEPAVERFAEALRLDPRDAGIHVNRGALMQQLGRVEEAIGSYRQALELDPTLAEAHCNLATALQELEKPDEAAAHYRATLALRPEHARAWYNLGVLAQNEGNDEEARGAFGTASRLRPEYERARWKSLLDLPVLIRAEEEIAPLRARWRAGVEALSASIRLDTPARIREAWEAAEAVSNFYLNYHGLNDRDEQILYGKLLTRVARAAFPAHADRPEARERKTGEKIRVGFVSSFFYGHSIFKTHGRWLTGLHPDRFERLVFHTGARVDLSSRYLQERVDLFQPLPPSLPAERIIETIVQARLDILIYTDLGMEPRLHPISALRLAPLQCNGGGHPITSGLEAIDVFLSSDLMEPEDAEGHYSERLIRLPNLASSYLTPRVGLARPPEGFEPGRVNYVNLQSLFKLLPRHDDLYPRIAREVPGSRFFFIGWTPTITERFRVRLREAFARHGLDAGAFCTILPRMPQESFFGLARAADVILDGIDWSGNNSSLEALAFGTPIVTLAGSFFRSRHTFGIFRRLGLMETVARDLDDYVALAVRLGEDVAWRQHVRAAILAQNARLYEDPAVPAALGAVLEELVGRG
ncbi:hypothetical protein SIID45300_01186 [Candidatus Magnetaquicoccaceae bacterium FCR-1]|uniref:protein O-GlcNAc transferase n=1 Tax=Candidatus Magnetaquiglobus chichijimensis TaxID=3141448 RepID=A0ABQ0C7L7_9PROT